MTQALLDIDRRRVAALALSLALPARLATAQTTRPLSLQSWPLLTPARTGIHDLAPAPDGGVWFSAQHSGHLGWFDPKDRPDRAGPARPGSCRTG